MNKKMCIEYINDENAYKEYLNSLDSEGLNNEINEVYGVAEELKYQYRYLTSYLFINIISESKNYQSFYKKQNIDKETFLKGFISHLDFVKNCADNALNSINNIPSEISEDSLEEFEIDQIVDIYKDVKVYYERLDNLAGQIEYEICSAKITLGEDVDSSIKEQIESYPSFVFGMEKQEDGTYNLDKKIEWYEMLQTAIEVIEDKTL